MNCSICAVEQVLTEPRAIDLDCCCMLCRGAELDWAELNKVIRRWTSALRPVEGVHEREANREYDDHRGNSRPGRERESFWEELVDFG
jgi:Zn-finger nucleic acid-binding protein